MGEDFVDAIADTVGVNVLDGEVVYGFPLDADIKPCDCDGTVLAEEYITCLLYTSPSPRD